MSAGVKSWGLAMAAVAISRTDLSAAELRVSAAHMKDARPARRALAIAAVLEGASREDAARSMGMDRQTLRDWVRRYNDNGLDGLYDLQAPGREPALTEAQEQELIRWVEAGSELERDGVVRWRRVDLRDRILREFGIGMHERTVGKLLEKHDYCRLTVRPQHPKSDPVAQQAFKADFTDLVRTTIPPEAAGKPIEIWWQDEARVGQQGTLTRIWAKRGSRPRALPDQRRNSAYLFGAICPCRRVGAAVVMAAANTESMNAHLKEISSQCRATAKLAGQRHVGWPVWSAGRRASGPSRSK